MKIKSDIANSVTADYVVTEVLSDTYDDAGILKEKCYRWLFRVWTRLNISLIRTKREVILPIAPGTKTMWLPPDYEDFIFLGYPQGDNRLPIAVNRNLAPRIGVENANACEVCGQTDLCTLEMQVTEETVTMEGVDYIKTTSRIIQPDGSYTEEVTEPVHKYNDDPTENVEMQTSRRVVCKLPDTCDTCVPATPGNLNMLAACGCTAALCSVSTDGLPYPVQPSNVHYNLFEQEGFIQFNSDCCLSKALLAYVSRGICINGVYYFPLAAMETLVAGTYYRMIEKKKNITLGEKDRARRAYTAEIKELVRNFTRQNYDEWLAMITTIPRLPTL